MCVGVKLAAQCVVEISWSCGHRTGCVRVVQSLLDLVTSCALVTVFELIHRHSCDPAQALTLSSHSPRSSR